MARVREINGSLYLVGRANGRQKSEPIAEAIDRVHAEIRDLEARRADQVQVIGQAQEALNQVLIEGGDTVNARRALRHEVSALESLEAKVAEIQTLLSDLEQARIGQAASKRAAEAQAGVDALLARFEIEEVRQGLL